MLEMKLSWERGGTSCHEGPREDWGGGEEEAESRTNPFLSPGISPPQYTYKYFPSLICF